MDKELFADRLIALRKKKGYKNQNQFADAYNKKFPPKRKDEAGGNTGSGILGTIKHYENPNYCRSYPSLDKVLNMCDLLDCDIDYLTGRLDEKTHTVSFICQYTGLTEKAVELLHYLASSKLYDEKRTVDFLNKILSDPRFEPSAQADDQLETIVVSLDDLDQYSEKPENQQILVNPDLKVIETLFANLDQYISSRNVEREIREESQELQNEEFTEFEKRIVKIKSSDDLTEIVDIPSLYRSYKIDQIRKELDYYLSEEQEEK